MNSPAELTEVLIKPQVDTSELTPFLAEVLHQDPGVPTKPTPTSFPAGAVPVQGLLGWGGFVDTLGTFEDPAWHLYKRFWGVKYDQVGEFEGEPVVTVSGGRDYLYRPGVPALRFRRANGEEVTPGTMVTDAGSIPRICWAIPGLDPWTFLPAFLVHDWDFMAHHCVPDYPRTFEQANDTLAEAVYTMMVKFPALQDWRVLVAIHTGCSSFVGRKLWGRAWTADQCQLVLNP